MGVVLAPAIGPSIGGVLVDWFGWRSIFHGGAVLRSVHVAGLLQICADHCARRWQLIVAARRWTGSDCCWQTAGTLSLLNGLVHLHDGALLAGRRGCS